MSSQLTNFAPAKINLFLHVTGKRADGYHLLDSLVAFTEFGDRVEVEAADRLSLEVVGALDVPHEHNLVWKAAVALQAACPRPLGARITLRKYIPVGAGLGGGSADAAAALRALSALWDVAIPAHLPLALGSDVPVCMASMPAFMRGVGGALTPVALAAAPAVLLANPNIPLATADVFRAFTGEMERDTALRATLSTTGELLDVMKATCNMLEKPAISRVPVIGEMLAALRATDDCLIARMSGSGATCFAIYDTTTQAAAAHTLLKTRHPHWWYQVTSLRGSNGKTQ